MSASTRLTWYALVALLGAVAAAGCSYETRRALDIRGFATELAGAKEDNDAWERTRAQNTCAAYEAYLARFPSGLHEAEAHRAYPEAAWREALAANTEDAFLKYKKRFPQGAHAAQALDRAGAAAYAEAMALRQVAPLRAAFQRYPRRREAAAALGYVAQLELHGALTGTDPLAAVRFLVSYPQHPRAAEVEARLGDLEKMTATTLNRPLVFSLLGQRFPRLAGAAPPPAKGQGAPPTAPPQDPAAAAARADNQWVTAARCLASLSRTIRFAGPSQDLAELERWREDLTVVLGDPATAAQCSRELLPMPTDPLARKAVEALGALGVELDQLTRLVADARENSDVLRNIVTLGRNQVESLERREVVGDALGEGTGGRLSELARQAIVQASAGAASADRFLQELEALEQQLRAIVVTLLRYATWALDTRQ